MNEEYMFKLELRENGGKIDDSGYVVVDGNLVVLHDGDRRWVEEVGAPIPGHVPIHPIPPLLRVLRRLEMDADRRIV